MDIPAAVWNGAGVIGLVAGLYWMLATGRLVTRREHDSVREDRDYWRATAMTGIGTASKLAEQKSVGIAAVESIARHAAATNGGDG